MAVKDTTAFKLNICIIGNIARAYAAGSNSCPQRGWGAEMGSQRIVWEGDAYDCMYGTCKEGEFKGKAGVTVTISRNVLNGGKEREAYFIPNEDLDRVELRVRTQKL